MDYTNLMVSRFGAIKFYMEDQDQPCVELLMASMETFLLMELKKDID